ncbi:hypothetical protein BC629DRAFT_1265675, partial [Irpex lacteus]
LRRLFVTMLIFCNLTNPLALWLEFRSKFCDDLAPRISAALHCAVNAVSDEERYNFGL